MRGHFKNLHSNKWEILKEIDKYLGLSKLPNLKQEQTDHLNTLIIKVEVETIKKKKKKAQAQMDSQQNSTRLSSDCSQLVRLQGKGTLVHCW